uniref:non-specific serine/threonine protein kinase n=1 Tax=Panagrellus redivivus TaxID=6233 RepID=A0A7E4VFL9_PANRE
MPVQNPLKPGNLKDPAIAALFSSKDPEQRYNDLREIGHGSFGAVYFALDNESGENVAIKKMSFSGKQAAERWADIVKEVGFLKKIRHQHIVEYRACFLKEQTCWLVMEYCVGSAADIVEVHKTPIFEPEIAAICQQALNGLAYLHEINRIHRDVKAGNILLTDCGIVKLADLGSISAACPAQSFVGTPYWMAPEVILAMDEGHYDYRADIWSFGITCIELAERKPPFFNMNTMSALYHIAQNDPPKLQSTLATGETAPWTETFYSFVDQCLRKDPEQRLSTRACLNHPFVAGTHAKTVILELIRRTKRVVRELDNFQYKKMRKLMYLDEQQLAAGAAGVDAISVDSHEGMLLDDENVSVHSDGIRAETCSSISETSGHSSRISSQRRVTRPPLSGVIARLTVPEGVDTAASSDASSTNRTVISVGDDHKTHNTTTSTERTFDTTTSTDPTFDTTTSTDPTFSSDRSSSPPSTLGISPFHENISKEEAINTLRRTKFSTLRTTKQISREVEAHRTENNIYEQMFGYRRMRQAHHKEVRSLDDRIQVESDQLKNRLEKEYDRAVVACENELAKIRQSQQAELDKRHRQNEEELRKVTKSRKNVNEHELKTFINIQKKEYKHNKELEKSNLKQRNLSRSQYDSMLKAAKNEFALQKQNAEIRFRDELNARLNDEVFNVRKQQTAAVHEVESRLLRDELNLCAKQIEVLHSLLRRHHRTTENLEKQHLEEVERLKHRHMCTLHETELNNQKDYTRRTLDDLKKTHALQSKQHPRELKNKEALIRKQFRHTCKTQTRQYKAYQAQLVQSVAREEQKELISKLKAEQTRKIADLAEQYERTIKDMMSEQTVKLETWQEDKLKQVSEKLAQEMDELRAYQEKQREIFDSQCQRDRTAMQDRINHRRSMLETRMEDELAKFEKGREEQLRVMKERHQREMAVFETNPSPESTVSSSATASATGGGATSVFQAGSQFSSNSSPSGSHSSPSPFKSAGTHI